MPFPSNAPIPVPLPPGLPTVGALAADLLKYRGTYSPGALAAGFEREWLQARQLLHEQQQPKQPKPQQPRRRGQPIELTEQQLEAWFHIDRHARKPVRDAVRARARRTKCWRELVYNAKQLRRWLCRGKCEPVDTRNDASATILKLRRQRDGTGFQHYVDTAGASYALYKASAIALTAHITIVLVAIVAVMANSLARNLFALLLQMGFLLAVVAAFSVQYQLVGAFEDIFEEHLASPIIPLPDSVSLEIQIDETDPSPIDGPIKARLLLRHRLWVEDTTFDASIMRLVVVNRESFPSPALCRRGIQIVTPTKIDASVIHEMHTLRILIAAALSRLECAMYDVACGYREDTDRDRKMAIGLSPRSKRMEDRRAALLKTDRAMANLDAWRFASLASKPLGLIESEKVEAWSIQNQFKLDRRLAALQNTSLDEMVVFFRNLVLRLVFNAVEASQITPTTELFDEHDFDENRQTQQMTKENSVTVETTSEEDRRAQDAKAVPDDLANGRTTTMRMLPSLQHALALPPKVFKDVLLQFRESILNMAQLLCDQLDITPGMSVEKVSLLDSLLADTEGAMGTAPHDIGASGSGAPSGTGIRATAADLHRRMQKMSLAEQMDVSFKRGKVVDWLVDWIWEHVFCKAVDLLARTYLPDSQRGLPFSDETVRHITCSHYRVYEEGLRQTLWRDIDQRFLSTFPPFRLNENFRGYFDRMGIKMISDTDVYGDEKDRKKTEMRELRRRRDQPKSVALPEARRQPEWKRMLSDYYRSSVRTLTDFDETCGSIPVMSLRRILADGAADFATAAGSALLSRRVSGTPVSVHLISLQNIAFAIGKAQEISAMFLPLLLLAERTPTRVSVLVHAVYPEWHGLHASDESDGVWNVWQTSWRVIVSAFLGVPLDMRDPSAVLMAIVMSNVLAFLLFCVTAFFVARLWVSGSPWLRTFFTSLSAIERRWTIEKGVRAKHWARSSRINVLPKYLRKSRSPTVLRIRDFLQSTAFSARWLSGASWSILMETTVGDLVGLDTRPPQARNIVHAAKLTKAFSVLCVVGEVILINLVAGASLSVRCVLCSNSLQKNPMHSRSMMAPDTGHEEGHMQWAGIAICGGSGAQYAMASISLVFLTPLLVVLTASIAIFPSVIRLHDFFTRTAGAGLHWPAGFNAGVNTSLFSDGLVWAEPRKASFRIASKCLLVSTVVIFSESNITLSIGVVVSYTLFCHAGHAVDVLCALWRSHSGILWARVRRNACCNLCLSVSVGTFLLVLAATTEPNASQEIYEEIVDANLTRARADTAAATKNEPTSPAQDANANLPEDVVFNPSLLPSCEFDDSECAWEASGQVAFKRRTHPVTKSKAALVREAKAEEKTGGAAAAEELKASDVVDRYLESGSPTTKECLTTCGDVFWAFLDVKDPFYLDPLEVRTCMRFSYRIRLGENPEKPQSGFIAVYQESRDKSRWIPVWNITSSNADPPEQALAQDWGSTGRIFLDNKESPTRIRVETALVGGGSDCSIDAMDFGCVDPGPAAPKWPALIASCWDDWSVGNEAFPGGLAILFVMAVLSILWKSLWARRVGAHLMVATTQPAIRRKNDDNYDALGTAETESTSLQSSQKRYVMKNYNGTHCIDVEPEVTAVVASLVEAVVRGHEQDAQRQPPKTSPVHSDETQPRKLAHKLDFTVLLESSVKKRVLTPQLPENTPVVHRNPTIPSCFSPFPKQHMLSLSFQSIEAKNTASRFDSLCRVSMFLPAETLSQPQKSYMVGASADREGRVIQKCGVLYRRVNVHDCPITLNAREHKWYDEENPSFGFSSVEEMVAAEFVVWVGPAFWFRISESLESNATSKNGAVSIRFNLRDLVIRNAEQEWLNDDGFVFLPRSSSRWDDSKHRQLHVKASQESLTKRREFFERASTQVWDVARSMILGDPQVSHLRLGLRLNCTALLRPALEQMFSVEYKQRATSDRSFCSRFLETKLRVCNAKMTLLNRRKCLQFSVLTSSLQLSRRVSTDGKKGILDVIIMRTARVSTGQPVIVKRVIIEEDHLELSCADRWSWCRCPGRCCPGNSARTKRRRWRRHPCGCKCLRECFCMAKLFVLIARFLEFCTTCVCEGVYSIFICFAKSVFRCYRFVTKREIRVGLDPNQVWPDGGKSPSRVRPSQKLLVQHKFGGGKINEGGVLSNGPERTLFTFREAVVKQVPVVGGRGRVLVTYPGKEEGNEGELPDEWVHISQLREPEFGVKNAHGAKYRAKTSFAAAETTPQELSEWQGYNWGGYSSEDEEV